jgi:glycosyltransferase involved in cell wall biosynthesis
MPKRIIEVLTPFDSREAVQRMKIDALARHKADEFDFVNFGEADTPAAILINSLNSHRAGVGPSSALFSALEKKAKTAVIMLFAGDVFPASIPVLRAWSSLVDIFLVPTPEMRNFLSAFTDRRVEVLIDPIDFELQDSRAGRPNDGPIKVVWFGYPETYPKSMGEYEATLQELQKSREIEYHVITRNKFYGDAGWLTIHEYDPSTFILLLQSFDVCVVSHMPFDFTLGTYFKSENKMVLAVNRGLAVVASRTPAYERVLSKCGLDAFLFSSKDELTAALRRLQSWATRQNYLSRIQGYVLENYTSTKMTDDWLKLYRDAQKCKQ